MKRCRILFAMLGVLAIASVAQASIVVNFDDVATPNVFQGTMSWGSIPASYAGLQWAPVLPPPGSTLSNWEVGDSATYKTAYRNSYGAPSGPNFAYNGTGLSVSTVSGAPFNFLGAQFSTWAQDNTYQNFSSTTVTITGYLGNSQVGSSVIVGLPSTTFTGLTGALLGGPVDRITFVSDNPGAQRWWLMDNMTYDPVPEPASLILWGLGGLGMAFGAFRRRWKK